jgi:hypothetical protein
LVQLQEEGLQAEGVQFLELLQYLAVQLQVVVVLQEEVPVVVLQEEVPVVVLQEGVRHLPYLPIHH